MSFEPNWVSPPGATIERIMSAREIGHDELADALGITRCQVADLISGELRIHDELAKLISESVGSSPRFWKTRDERFEREVKRVQNHDPLQLTEWARKMPVKSLREFGILKKGTKHEAVALDLLKFFNCKNFAEWNARFQAGTGDVLFRSSSAFQADSMSTLVWKRMGEIQYEAMNLPPYNPDMFKALLPKLRKITVNKSPETIILRLQSLCREVGVAVTSGRAPEGCRASGAAWWTDTGNPVIHLSFRHLTNDHFWFTFFHECGHVLLHQGDFLDLDRKGSPEGNDRLENEANQFASETLIPDDAWRELSDIALTAKKVISLARGFDISPGILVGQLEKREMVSHRKLSFLKHRYVWGSNPFIPGLK
ncbi:MAG: ImmA/IrrE family metallo-endopeptidase [Sulfitobacter sp.]|uniref:ImmA/IrrE family metallo-endopeptidase n=1 Tax=Sulfitobacter sp. TaxID=1903071 RepID=UPI0030015AB9